MTSGWYLGIGMWLMIIAPLLVNVYPKHIHAVYKCITQLVIHKTLRMLHVFDGGKPGKREVGTPSMHL